MGGEHSTAAGALAWREFTLTVPGLPKEPPVSDASAKPFGSGYSYQGQDAAKSRFIIWYPPPQIVGKSAFAIKTCNLIPDYRKVFGETLELVELSVGVDLVDNALRLHLPRPIVGDVIISEKPSDGGGFEALHVVVHTTRTLHRFVFDHPLSPAFNSRAQKQSQVLQHLPLNYNYLY